MRKGKRILLKLSGESLAAGEGFGIQSERLNSYAEQIAGECLKGHEIAIVIGGGNIFRGMSGVAKGFDRVTGDSMGMLATVINSLALKAALESFQCKADLFTAQPMGAFGTHYNVNSVNESLAQGHVALLSGGTGNPFFTTDSAAALRACELNVGLLLKGTRVDGIYTADPEKDPGATKYTSITYKEVYTKGLHIMDLTAMTLCEENNMPIVVFDMDTTGNLSKLLAGDLALGTIVTRD